MTGDSGVRGRFAFFPLLFLAASAGAQIAKKPITVADAIGTTRLEERDYLAQDPNQVAHFSPDGMRFVLVLRKANLERNTNEYSVLLYHTADALRAPKPELLLKMSSSSNRSAISQLRWLADNETLVFLGENSGELSQVYSFNLRAKALKRLTNHSTAIDRYDITPDGGTVAFAAGPPPAKALEPDQEPSREIVIDGQYLYSILTGDYSHWEG